MHINHGTRRRTNTMFKSARRRAPSIHPSAAGASTSTADGPLTVRGLAKRMHARADPSSAGNGNGRRSTTANPSSSSRNGPRDAPSPSQLNIESVRQEMNGTVARAIRDLTERADRVHQVMARCTQDAKVFADVHGDDVVDTIRRGEVVLLSTWQTRLSGTAADQEDDHAAESDLSDPNSEGTVLSHMYHVDAVTGQTTSRFVTVYDPDGGGHRFEFLNRLPL